MVGNANLYFPARVQFLFHPAVRRVPHDFPLNSVHRSSPLKTGRLSRLAIRISTVRDEDTENSLPSKQMTTITSCFLRIFPRLPFRMARQSKKVMYWARWDKRGSQLRRTSISLYSRRKDFPTGQKTIADRPHRERISIRCHI